ncbi:MAG: hypothetical protein ABT01_07290 [Clostridium sp. SCN 57-10]|nr:MAG: hypothetical protein ABT01_07290 [Clostridium sp. SCN 57-10]
MIKLKQALIVEGRYDKNKLAQLFDTLIIEVGGFGVYRDERQLSLIRTLARTRGIIVLTDADSAGFQIRNYLKGAVFEGEVLHAYIPDLYGREKRKEKASKEGKLGVEGVPNEVLMEAIARCGALSGDNAPAPLPIDRALLYRLGLSGGKNSAALREGVKRALGLPERMSSAGLASVLSTLVTEEELCELVERLQNE